MKMSVTDVSISRQYEGMSITYSLLAGRDVAYYGVQLEKHASDGSFFESENVLLSESKVEALTALRMLSEHEVMPIHLINVIDGVADRVWAG